MLSIAGAACSAEPEPPSSAPATTAPPTVAPPTDETQVVLRGIAATSPPEVAAGKTLFAEACVLDLLQRAHTRTLNQVGSNAIR